MNNKIIIDINSIDIDSAYRLYCIVDKLIKKNIDGYLIKNATCRVYTNIND